MKYVFSLVYGAIYPETERRLLDVGFMSEHETQEAAEAACKEYLSEEMAQEFPLDIEFVVRDHRY